MRQIECECSLRENKTVKILDAVNSSKFRCVLAAKMFAVSVTQKGLDYFVLTLRTDQLQAYKNS